ncbi:MAG: polysaccharide deacetylase family protein [Flavobacteriaceae bacterium]|nr:polysaccharide deacetylase family protein [Flavobacteriaceae bacterium]
MKQHYLFILFILILACGKNENKTKETQIADTLIAASEMKDTLKVSFTFDDGITHDLAGFKFKDWNQMILTALREEGIKAAFFVTGSNKIDEKGSFLLDSWATDGHMIANHSYTHPNFNDQKMGAEDFESELLKTDTLIKKYPTYQKLFRFPYLNAGKTEVQADGYRSILKKHGYKSGRVTIDNSEWYINSQLIKCIRKEGLNSPKVARYKAYYLQHILENAAYYESLSYAVSKRHINHTLLLHHNLTSALFLPDLIEAFKAKGWQIVNSDVAFKDPFFKREPKVLPAGESLAWAAAKASGSYEHLLRYPAEDGGYEAEQMKKLGL